MGKVVSASMAYCLASVGKPGQTRKTGVGTKGHFPAVLRRRVFLLMQKEKSELHLNALRI